MEYVYKYLSIIEQLYPYSLFCSIGAKNCTVRCSICGRSPFDPECNHISGELYWGEMAHRIIENIGELNHIALTPNPDDKRCVLCVECDKNKIMEGPFRDIHSFISYSGRPFRSFMLEKSEKIVSRDNFKNTLDIDLCPCGSGLPFKECCRNKEFITVPHYEIIFDEIES